ncbi:hypothetical protein [Hyphobacterium sp.]|uniref:hypothetical protein n=1 Tax=Hyphobacterium sp. TaxID=2004662 RepID=UPI003BAA65C3
MINKTLLLAAGLTLSLSGLGHAQTIGGHINLQGIDRDGDLKAIAGSIEVSGRVGGDVALAGGNVQADLIIGGDAQIAGGNVEASGDIGGDAAMAGGSVQIRMDIGDDADFAGGYVSYSGTIGGDLDVAVGDFELTPGSVVTGRAAMTGREIELEGRFLETLDITAEEVTLAGQYDGDIRIEARRLTITDTAVVNGAIDYTGPNQADISGAAQLATPINYTFGEFEFEWQEDAEELERIASLIEDVIPPAEFFLVLIGGFSFLLGLLAMAFMPNGVGRLSRKFRENAFVAPLIGLFMLPMGWLILMVTGTILLAITVVGVALVPFWWLFGLFVLLLAFPLGAIAVGDLIFNRTNRPNPGFGLRLLSLFVIVMLASALWAVAPPLGLIAGLLLSWIGLGAWAFAAFGSKEQPAPPAAPETEAV